MLKTNKLFLFINVKTVKLLGLQIDDGLKWSVYSDNLCDKISERFFVAAWT